MLEISTGNSVKAIYVILALHLFFSRCAAEVSLESRFNSIHGEEVELLRKLVDRSQSEAHAIQVTASAQWKVLAKKSVNALQSGACDDAYLMATQLNDKVETFEATESVKHASTAILGIAAVRNGKNRFGRRLLETALVACRNSREFGGDDYEILVRATAGSQLNSGETLNALLTISAILPMGGESMSGSRESTFRNYLVLSRAYTFRGDLIAADRACENAKRIATSEPALAEPYWGEYFLAKSRISFDGMNDADAPSMISEALDKLPVEANAERIEALLLQTRIIANAGRTNKARDSLESANRLLNQDFGALHSLRLTALVAAVEIELLENNLAAAAAILKDAKALCDDPDVGNSPDFVELCLMFVRYCAAVGSVDQAMEGCNTALMSAAVQELRLKKARVLHSLAVFSSATNTRQSAHRLHRRSNYIVKSLGLSAHPLLPENEGCMGRLDMADGRFEQALGHFEAAQQSLSQIPNDTERYDKWRTSVAAYIGLCKSQLGRNEEGQRELSACLHEMELRAWTNMPEYLMAKEQMETRASIRVSKMRSGPREPIDPPTQP